MQRQGELRGDDEIFLLPGECVSRVSASSRRRAFVDLTEELARRGLGGTATRLPGLQLTGVERLLHSEGAVALIGRWRTALALQLVASRSTEGAWSAWIDLAGGFYPAGAARLGVRLSRLVWVRPPDLRGALWAAHVLLVGGAVRLVVVDLPELSALNRGLELSLTRLVRDARGGQRSLFILATAPLPGVKSTVYPREVNGRLIASFHERPRGGVHHGDSS